MHWRRPSLSLASTRSSAETDTTIRLRKYFALPAQFWLNLRNDYDLRIAEGSGIGKRIKSLKITQDAAHTGAQT
jgi:plasmid maintenance system antidote protein VapI